MFDLSKDLFGNPLDAKIPKDNKKSKAHREYKTNYEFYNMDLFGDLEMNEYDLPIIKEFVGEPPTRLVPFNVAMTKRDFDCTVHFYINDPLFAKVRNNPERYLSIMQRFKSVISPDFSQYADFPYPLRLHNAYCNRALAAWWQQNGVNVIYNVTWSKPDSYNYSFSGIPQNTTIAINSNGIKNNNLSQYLWQRGYEEAVHTLSPSCIIRYGEEMPNEKREISLYFENEQIKRLRNGR